MLITISGSSGSGKSTAAKKLAEHLGMPTVDVGKIFRAMAKKRGMTVSEFGAYAERHPEIDHALDAAMLRRAKRAKNVILQGRLAGLMTAKEGMEAVRIWIDASPKVRAGRVAAREGISLKKALSQTLKRDRVNQVRYKRTYGLDVSDLKVYDIVVQSDNLNKEEVVSCLVKELTRIWPKTRILKSTKRKTSPKPRLKPRLRK